MENNPFQLTFTLKQHTPIIHFQHDQVGATLRATELKPKLDRWIIDLVFGEHHGSRSRLDTAMADPTLYPWLRHQQGKDPKHAALDYSLTIKPIGENKLKNEINARVEFNKKNKEVLKENDYPCFFGNQMDVVDFKSDKKKVKRLSYYSEVIIDFESCHPELLILIKQQFSLFLLNTNFGTRQSKGFGSFYIHSEDANFPASYRTEIAEAFPYYFDLQFEPNNEEKQIKALFSAIDLFYKTLRSGTHPLDKGMYFKSLMWKYAKSKGMQWDKKTIKQQFFFNDEMEQMTGYPDQDSPLNWKSGGKVEQYNPHLQQPKKVKTHLLWRDLLGLSSEQKWGSYNDAMIKKEGVIWPDQNKPRYTRFKSPIFFKPLRSGPNSFRVLFGVPDNVRDAFKRGDAGFVQEAEILGEWFEIIGAGTPFQVPFPLNFDFAEFFEQAFSTDPSSHVEDGEEVFQNHHWVEGYVHGKTRIKDPKNIENSRIIDNPDFYLIKDIYDQLYLQIRKGEKQ